MRILIIISFFISFNYAHELVGDLACECGCNMNNMDIEFLEKVKKLEKKCKMKFHITSGSRCKNYNSRVGGHSKSKHLTGMAIDIRYRNKRQLNKIKKYAKKSDYFTFVYDEGDHIHIEKGYGDFRFKTLDGVKRYNESYYFGYGANTLNTYYRMGYTSSDGPISTLLFVDKLDKSKILASKLAFTVGLQVNSPKYFNYISTNIGGGFAKDSNTEKNFQFAEPNITIGYHKKFIDFKIEGSYFYPFNNDLIEPKFRIGLILNIGTFNF